MAEKYLVSMLVGLGLALPFNSDSYRGTEGLESHVQESVDPFFGKKVRVFYSSNDGPTIPSDTKLYSPSRPVDSKFVSGVERELAGRGAYVLSEGVFRARYPQAVTLSLNAHRTADAIVIADKEFAVDPKGIDPRFSGDVYVSLPNGERYEFKKIKELKNE